MEQERVRRECWHDTGSENTDLVEEEVEDGDGAHGLCWGEEDDEEEEEDEGDGGEEGEEEEEVEDCCSCPSTVFQGCLSDGEGDGEEEEEVPWREKTHLDGASSLVVVGHAS